MRYKYAFDRIISLILLLTFSPVLLCVAIAIKLTSKGPVIFVQDRVGQNGTTFKFFKFRTMVVGAEELKAGLLSQNEMDGPVFKITNDPRVTKVGAFLRKMSLDELPQLFNVLIGDMSLVGPRPPLPTEVAHYEDWHHQRLTVRPGITCTWQVSGRNQITSFDVWVKSDIAYIENYSFWTDIKLLVQTVPAVLIGKGAA